MPTVAPLQILIFQHPDDSEVLPYQKAILRAFQGGEVEQDSVDFSFRESLNAVGKLTDAFDVKRTAFLARRGSNRLQPDRPQKAVFSRMELVGSACASSDAVTVAVCPTN
jgi:hypothetical protein